MQMIIDFYKEKIKVGLPQSLNALKNTISKKLILSKEDVNEFILSNKESGIQITKEEDYQNLLKSNKDKNSPLEINIEINENSLLFKNTQNFISSEIKIKNYPKPLLLNESLGVEYEFVEDLSDEFSGNSLDSKKWWDFNPSWRCRKPSLFSRNHVKVENNLLHLTASRMKPEEIDPEMDVRGYNHYWTSYVKSIKRISYGFFECRCKSMKANVCNAFWLYDPHSDQPDLKYTDKGGISEEIDIVELFGKCNEKLCPGLDTKYAATVHAYNTPYIEGIVNKSKTKLPDYAFKAIVDFKFYEDFHTYGLLWTPTEISWYLDGKKYFTRTNDVFNRPLHVCLDCEVQCDWAGLPQDEDLPSTFEIDFVHVYQIKGVSEIIDFNYENLQAKVAQPPEVINLVDKDKENKEIHKGFSCIGCPIKNIRGILYKCPICINYCLCEKCEEKYGKKHKHPLIKIRKAKDDNVKLNMDLIG